MVLARSCALTAVAAFLAVWLRRQEQTVRQQLRELCYEAKAKRGDQRRALAVEPCFVPLLVWVLSRWQGTGTAFKNSQGRLRCTLLARWEEGYSDPWIILTDLPPEASEAGWYGLRA